MRVKLNCKYLAFSDPAALWFSAAKHVTLYQQLLLLDILLLLYQGYRSKIFILLIPQNKSATITANYY